MILYYISLLYLPASILEMMRGGIIIYVAIFSMIFLNKKLCISEIFGMFLVIVGLIVVGLAYNLNIKYDTKYFWYGVIALLFSMFFDGIYYISVEKLYQEYHINSTFMIAWSGTWGFLMNVLPVIFLGKNKLWLD